MSPRDRAAHRAAESRALGVCRGLGLKLARVVVPWLHLLRARRELALQLLGVGLEPHRWETNAARRGRLRAWMAKPAPGSEAHIRLLGSEAAWTKLDKVGVCAGQG